MKGKIQALSISPTHTMSKQNRESVRLIKGHGVEGDAHMGEKVKHRSRVAKDPSQPNLRQVHLIHAELFAELAGKGFSVKPGVMGENITTIGVDLLALPRGTHLYLGECVLEVTGLRNPCHQLEGIQKGLMKAVLDRDDRGELVRKAGIMTIVIAGGDIHVGDEIKVQLPEPPHQPLMPV